MKRKRNILIALAGLSFMGLQAMAQDVTRPGDEEVWLEQLVSEYSYQIPSAGNLNNKAFVVQEGANNDAFVDQSHSGGSTPNTIYMLQRGNNNTGSILQTGSNNKYNIYQLGDGNLSDLMMSGTKNRSTLVQEGNLNKVRQELTGDGMKYVILQEGFRNELIHKENGEVNQEYTIQMKGNGMKVYIENSNIYK